MQIARTIYIYIYIRPRPYKYIYVYMYIYIHTYMARAIYIRASKNMKKYQCMKNQMNKTNDETIGKTYKAEHKSQSQK